LSRSEALFTAKRVKTITVLSYAMYLCAMVKGSLQRERFTSIHREFRMHLSEILLDSRLAGNPYEIHRHLWRLFLGMSEDKRSFLYRVSHGKDYEPFRILMQSLYEPSATDNKKGCAVLRKKAFNPVFKEKDLLRFELCANPTKRLSQERCRVPLIDEDQLFCWLQKKLENAATVEHAEIIGKRNLYFRKNGKAGKIVTITFGGHLNVRDPEQMRTILENGIGPAKAFGCGLLSLARA
jgi:CRISPR system Cascade subunit CasE